MPTITINALGEVCPLPVVKTVQVIKQMQTGGRVQTHVDNEIAVQNLLKMASNKALEATVQTVDSAHFVVSIAVGEALPKTSVEAPIACLPDKRSGTVVAIDTDAMGRGDDTLGKTLMKGFLYALAQLDELPKTILLYNSGAKLSVEDSVSLEDLQLMEAQGVEILTCGTCLNFYGITDKLAVGSVTNMYTIVETLLGAAHVVKP